MSKVKSISISNKVKTGTSCVVCGEFVELNEWEARHAGFRLCDECIRAIKFARRLMIANPRADKMLPCLEDDIK